MSQAMSYAQALNEAKQMIVQQQYRIKADAEKVKAQQQQIIDQSAVMIESERKTKEFAADSQRLNSEIEALRQQLTEVTTAKEQTEALVYRQGQQITTLQSAASEMEKKIAFQTGQIASITSERDTLLAQLPTKEDEEALYAMADLLKKRPASLKRPAPILLAEVVSEPDNERRAEAA